MSTKSIWLSFGTALAIFVLVGVVSQARTRKLIEASDKSVEANQILISLEILFSTLQDAETGQRGYLITGDPKYLEPYLHARAVLGKEWADLEIRNAKSPDTAIDLAALKPIIDDKMTEMQENIEERERLGLPKATITMESGRGMKDMNEIRRLVGLQASKLNGAIEQRTQLRRNYARQVETILWALGIIGAGLLLASHYRLHCESAVRQRTAAELQTLNNELESRVQARTREMHQANEALRNEIKERSQVESELNFRKTLFKSVSECSIEGILVVSLKEKHILYFNHRMLEMWRVPEDIVKQVVKHSRDGTLLNWAVSQMADPEGFLKGVTEAYERLDLELHDEIHLKDGRTFDRHGASIRNAQGDNFGWVWSFRDVTKYRQTEQDLSDAKNNLELRVHERTAQLEAVNKELEAFSYSISHDLRSPIRTIASFAELLVEEQAGRLDAEGAIMLNSIRQAAQNMDRMVTGMLELARLGQQPMAKSKVDMNRLAQKVMGEQLPRKPDRNVTVNIHPLPYAYGNETALRQVFENLFSNALKYTRNCPDPTIEVGARQEGAEQIYFVKDNGAGFDMNLADKLFIPFQRLHGGEFEGTGVGLATVRRIINHHGGRVWAESKVNEGATFFFSLPLQSE